MQMYLVKVFFSIGEQVYHNMNLYDYTKDKPDYEVEQERWEKEGYDV